MQVSAGRIEANSEHRCNKAASCQLPAAMLPLSVSLSLSALAVLAPALAALHRAKLPRPLRYASRNIALPDVVVQSLADARLGLLLNRCS